MKPGAKSRALHARRRAFVQHPRRRRAAADRARSSACGLEAGARCRARCPPRRRRASPRRRPGSRASSSAPGPASPMCVAVVPIAAKIGAARSNASRRPPTMIESVPAIGALLAARDRRVEKSTPCRRGARRERRAAAGAIVLVSITSSPGAAPARMPSGPATTASTSGVSGTHVTTASTARRDRAARRPPPAPAVDQRRRRAPASGCAP